MLFGNEKFITSPSTSHCSPSRIQSMSRYGTGERTTGLTMRKLPIIVMVIIAILVLCCCSVGALLWTLGTWQNVSEPSRNERINTETGTFDHRLDMVSFGYETIVEE